jgi:hypothetical protein
MKEESSCLQVLLTADVVSKKWHDIETVGNPGESVLCYGDRVLEKGQQEKKGIWE